MRAVPADTPTSEEVVAASLLGVRCWEVLPWTFGRARLVFTNGVIVDDNY